MAKNMVEEMNIIGWDRNHKFWFNNKGTFSISFGRFYFYSNSEEQRTVLELHGQIVRLAINTEPQRIVFRASIGNVFFNWHIKLFASVDNEYDIINM